MWRKQHCCCCEIVSFEGHGRQKQQVVEECSALCEPPIQGSFYLCAQRHCNAVIYLGMNAALLLLLPQNLLLSHTALYLFQMTDKMPHNSGFLQLPLSSSDATEANHNHATRVPGQKKIQILALHTLHFSGLRKREGNKLI